MRLPLAWFARLSFLVCKYMVEQNLENGSNGWIKIHRKLLENPIASKSNYMNVWIHLLLMANHEEEKCFIWNGQNIKQKAGEFITGRKQLSKNTGIPESTIEDILRYFEKEEIIRQHKTTKYRLITILKWDLYQKTDNKATTEQQQSDTIKNNNNYKNNTSKKEFLQTTQINELISLFKEVNPMYKDLFKRKNERDAINDLAEQLTYDKLKSIIEHLPDIINKPYAPKITSPLQLKRDLGKLVAFYNQEKSKLLVNKGKGFV